MPEITAPPVDSTPTNPAAPEAPVAPVDPAPADPAVVEPANPNPEPNEDQEWDEAEKELFPGLGDVKPEDKPADALVDPAAPADPAADPNKPAEPTDHKLPEVDVAAAEARIHQRQLAQESEVVFQEVQQALHPEGLPETMLDSDGDPIRSHEDLMKLKDPNTGEAFTEEDAKAWFNENQAAFERERSQILANDKAIAEVNIALKDEADLVNAKFGDYLRANPEVKTRLYAQWEKTVTKDKTTGIITKAPVSLLELYNVALGSQAQATDAAQAQIQEAQAAADKATQEAAAAKKQVAHTDRSDIYGANPTAPKSQEDKEWDDAAVAVYGPRK